MMTLDPIVLVGEVQGEPTIFQSSLVLVWFQMVGETVTVSTLRSGKGKDQPERWAEVWIPVSYHDRCFPSILCRFLSEENSHSSPLSSSCFGPSQDYVTGV